MHPSRLPLATFALASGLLAGCVPNLGRPPTLRTPETVAAARSFAADPAALWPVDTWWTGYGDPQLNTLIDEGLRGSPDIAIAAARLRRAAALQQQAGGALLPTVDAQGNVGLEKQSYTNGFPKEFVPKGWQDRGSLALALNFDLDLWGKNRAALRAATSETEAARYDAQQARLVLTTAIASAYGDLAGLYAERDFRENALKVRTTTAELVRKRVANGLGTRGDEQQAEANTASARSDLAAADEAIDLRRHQLAALVGAGPDRGLDVTRPDLQRLQQRGVPAGATTDLIGRRPDVAAARARAAAAASRIKVARADFFPSINIGALVGLQSLGLENLLKGDSLYGNVGPAISLPIFHGGALQGQYRGARATYDEAVGTYDRTVVDAYRDVADAVTSQRDLQRQLADARIALSASEQAYSVAQARFRGGLSTYLDVLVIEERLLNARLAVARLQARAFTLDVSLIRALGGGFVTPANAPSRDLPHG